MNEIIAKIQKLLALGNNKRNNSEAEAAAAMAKAQELLTKYNLDMAVIQDAAVKTGAANTSGPREKVQIKRSAMYRWQQIFWRSLSELNYCFHWVVIVSEEHSERKGHFRTVKRHVILGSQANVAAVQVMGDYLTEVMERDLPYSNTERLSRSAISWREGMADRLIERLTQNLHHMRRDGFTAEDGSQVTALAVQNVQEKEYAANYDASYGAGAYARMKVREAEFNQRVAVRRQQEAEERATQLAGETPEQRKERETQEAEASAKAEARNAKAWERYFKQQERQAARKDLTAYARGVKKADTINLNDQVKGN